MQKHRTASPSLSWIVAAACVWWGGSTGPVAFPFAVAQGVPGAGAIDVTVIVSDVGAAERRGTLERTVAEGWAAERYLAGGIYGTQVAVDVRSDGGTIEGAVAAALDAVEWGAHAIVCCSVPAASSAVADALRDADVVLLSPSGASSDTRMGWQWSLALDDATALQAVVRDVYDRGQVHLGVMTVEGAFGDEVLRRIEGFLGAPELRIVGEARYRTDARVLTAEALWVATREPHVVVVWGWADDARRAIEGLRQRGWFGPIVLRPSHVPPEAIEGLAVAAGDVRWLVSPASLRRPVDDARVDSVARAWLVEAARLGQGLLETDVFLADGAAMFDALTLLAMAFEGAATTGVPPDEVRGFRIAVRDALVGLPPVTLAGGRYDATMDATVAVRADGTVAVSPSSR